MHSILLKRIKLVHACGPYGNDCGTVDAAPRGHRSASLSMPTLPKTFRYTAALESEANST
jgi:hypothetical protein